jgi:hypothetical protein
MAIGNPNGPAEIRNVGDRSLGKFGQPEGLFPFFPLPEKDSQNKPDEKPFLSGIFVRLPITVQR